METILVVDDEGPVVTVLRNVLEKNGYTILEATSAETAMQISDDYLAEIHLLITDHLLKRCHGAEVAERILKSRSRMKVLYMSGHNRDELITEGSLPPGAGFLQKPFLPGELRRAVRDLLDS